MSHYPDYDPHYDPYNQGQGQYQQQQQQPQHDPYAHQPSYRDPFITPPAPPPMPMHPGPGYASPPPQIPIGGIYPPHNTMSPPPPPPIQPGGLYPPSSPPPLGMQYAHPAAPHARPDTAYSRHTYDLRDDGPHEHDDGGDAGDIPLLRREPGDTTGQIRVNSYDDASSFVGGFSSGAPAMPGEYSEDPVESNIRYGRIPQRVPRRFKTIKKKVELFHGNFVLDSAVPSKLLALCKEKTEREFTHMRYSAATCDPNDFQSTGFTLRQLHYDPPRRTELFIVMTMYNEDDELFTRTMHGVMKNVAHLCTRDRSKTWGKEGWKKVVVCVVSDGRAKVNARTLSVLAAMGAYQEGVAKNVVDNKPVTAHIYEYTTQLSITPSLKLEGAEKGIVPVQILFCLKEQNAKKINSHRWFFNAFGPILQPNVCVLLDVGTQPGNTSIYHLWKAFDINSNVGGACGEIVALKGKWGLNLLNPLVAAQNFEYKISNILDKPLESLFGYITVLPGAFSAYRYIALQNDVNGEGPLQKYFLGEKMHGAGADIFTSNMYLAEDRILCWELVSKRGASWVLHYVKSAYAVTDVPDQVPELISQRRRWLNGSFFAAVHSTLHFHYIYRSSHTFMRKFWIHVELVYQTFNLIFSWFSLANYYIAFSILTSSLEDPSFGIKGIGIANAILGYFYLGLLVMCFILSLGNRPQGSKWGYTAALLGFALITIYMTVAAFWLAFKGIDQIVKEQGTVDFAKLFSNSIFRNIIFSLLATLGLYILASLIFFEPWHMITSFIQYLLMAPSYIAVLNVYAFANVHDVSWGTKGDNKAPAPELGVVKVEGKKNEVEVDIPTGEKDINAAYEDAIHVLQTKPPPAPESGGPDKEDYYKTIRTNVLLAWTLSNGLLGAAVVQATGKASDTGAQNAVKGYMTFLLFSVVGLAFIRFVGCTGYMIVRLFAGE